MTIHYDNSAGLADPLLQVWYPGSDRHHEVAAVGVDGFGIVYETAVHHPVFFLRFRQGRDGAEEPGGWHRQYRPLAAPNGRLEPGEVWCMADRAFVYQVAPTPVENEPAAAFLAGLLADNGAHGYVPDTGGLSGLGAHVLRDGRVLFGLYHPTAARVHLMGSFNGWQRPGVEPLDPGALIPLRRYEGWFGATNTWLVVTDRANVGDEYKFFVEGGVALDHKNRPQRAAVDPYARALGPDFRFNNPVVVDPATYAWSDAAWSTPDVADLVLYELSVHGFTDADPDVKPDLHGRFAGITERIRSGYFELLGVNALSLMPLAEVPSLQGPRALGYDPSLYCTVERDFGTPDDLRELVDTAHAHGVAVVIDLVFNHTSNDFNPMWGLVLEHPDEHAVPHEGGLYFNGSTPWGNRVATEKADVQNLLIDACKLLVHEYHVDGFRFDATHTYYMDHGLLHRLAAEVRAVKPEALLVAENLPNEADLNREGWNGYSQWCELFHDKVKALLREGSFESQTAGSDNLGDAFHFSRSRFAAHTNNVVNYCESHDEHSVPHELHFSPWLDHPAAKDRKGRLGMFATLVALGQPMLYMGQEFNIERPRNIVTVQWPADLQAHGFFQWCRRLVHLRRRYPALRLRGSDPEAAGLFRWILGPWLEPVHGGGRRVVGWRATPNKLATDTVVVALNFENVPVTVDLDLGIPGRWVKLADIDAVNDLPPHGSNAADDPTVLHTADGRFASFNLPDTSGFIYKWEAPA